MKFPFYVTAMIEKLRAAGFSAYAVGGCVRDSFLDRTPADWDVTTSATPSETMAVFAEPPFSVYAANGLKHGTVTVSLDGHASEITTYRTEGAYTDHRRPDEVHFVTNIRDDLSRRDFTVNAMAAAPLKDEAVELIDPFGGQRDLAAGILRAVGDPEKRMTEDALRILRGIRFAARYDFTVESETARAMHDCAPLLDKIAPERIGDEMRGILLSPHCKKLLAQFADIIARIFPAAAVSVLPDGETAPDVHLACLLSAYTPKEAEEILLKYAFGAARAKKIAAFLALRDADTSLHAVRCAVADKIGKDCTGEYFAFRRALAPTDKALSAHEAAVTALFDSGACYNVETLAVRGADLLAAGIPQGAAVGRLLARLTADVIAGKYKNDRDTLVRAAIAEYADM